jgi:hypothetical protein
VLVDAGAKRILSFPRTIREKMENQVQAHTRDTIAQMEVQLSDFIEEAVRLQVERLNQ